MLAVLENAVEYFQKYVLARKPSGKKLFQQAEEWLLEKNSDELFFSLADVLLEQFLNDTNIRRVQCNPTVGHHSLLIGDFSRH